MAQFENDDEVFFNVMPVIPRAADEKRKPEKAMAPDAKKNETPSAGTERIPRVTHANAEEPVFDVGSTAGLSHHPLEKKIVVSSETHDPIHIMVAEGPSRMVQSAKAIKTVTDRAETKTAPEKTVVKAGNMGRTVMPKKEIMDRDLSSRSPDASLKGAKGVFLLHPAHVAPTSYSRDFEASVVESLTDSECRVIALKGRIEHGQRAALEKFFDANLPLDGRRVILDMGGVVSMSSSGWGVVVAQLQRLKKFGGSVSLCGMHGEVEQCFWVLDLYALFPAFPSVADAMKSPVPKKGDFSASGKIKASLTAPKSLENLASLPLEEKIKRIVAENPYLGAGRIAKLLRSEAYGTIIINRWILQAKLKSMNLGTKEERYRFFRSS